MHFFIKNRNLVKIGKFAQLKSLTNRPDRSLPVNPLSTWRDLTPDIKLPDIRNRTLGDIYYTRGKLGQKVKSMKQIKVIMCLYFTL